jgi:hypothetical protein
VSNDVTKKEQDSPRLRSIPCPYYFHMGLTCCLEMPESCIDLRVADEAGDAAVAGIGAELDCH